MRSRLPASDANEPHAAAAPDDASPSPRPQTFRDRHALKVMGLAMVGMFATVIIAQVGC